MREEYVLDLALKITRGYNVKTIFKPIIVREIKKLFYKEFAEFMDSHSFISLINLNIFYGALLRLGSLDAKIKRSAYYIVKEVIENVDKEFVKDFTRVMNYLFINDALDEELKSKILQSLLE
ncbi:hypothetical protein DRN69_00225 [Candidatus Pacearchaeota archaeon]|nr:MAG: hypothetical protein DRN69_00225 [Candidatus Pacearchaeota archaeon]